MSHAIPIRVPPLELPPNSFRLHTCEKYPPKSFELHTYEIALPQVLWIAYLRNQGGWGGYPVSESSRGSCSPRAEFHGPVVPRGSAFRYSLSFLSTPHSVSLPKFQLTQFHALTHSAGGRGYPLRFSLAYFHRSTPGLRPLRTPAKPGFTPPGPHHRSRILGRRRLLALTPHLIACAGYPGGRIILPSALDPRRVAP